MGWNRDAADMIMMENEPLHKQEYLMRTTSLNLLNS